MQRRPRRCPCRAAARTARSPSSARPERTAAARGSAPETWWARGTVRVPTTHDRPGPSRRKPRMADWTTARGSASCRFMAVVLPSRWPLVGRTEVWRRLRVALDERARVVLIYGEAGVGKTRLADEAFSQSKRDGRAGLQVTATAPAGQIPLSVLAPLLTA